jgi:thioredoxin-like negative regulator of GroEL
MGPFVGVVGATKAALRKTEPSPGESKAVSLMKEGKFREAGKILAGGFQRTDDPRYPLLLAEVFFALGKPEHADALLRQAIDMKGVEDALPKEVSKHFPKPEEFESKVEDLASGNADRPLLTGYLLVHSKSPERGLDLLRKLSSQDPVDPAAGLLYRHYLGNAFKD